MRSEADVRKWLKAKDPAAGDSLFWVEHRGGGTVGITDVFIADDGSLHPVELKFGGIITGIRGTVNGAWWTVALRPGQVAFHRRAAKLNVRTSILVGSEWGDLLFWCDGARAVEAFRNGSEMKMVQISSWAELVKRL